MELAEGNSMGGGCSWGVSSPGWSWRVNLLGGLLVGRLGKDTIVGVFLMVWVKLSLSGRFVGG